jgi:hypothetical protein
MIDLINCGGCNAILKIADYRCNFCGLSMSNDTKNRELLRFIENFEARFLNDDEISILDDINKSVFINTVYGKYRRLKIELLIDFRYCKNIKSSKLNRILDELISLSSDNNEYLQDFVVYFSGLSQAFKNVIDVADYNLIFQKIREYKKDEFLIIEHVLKKALLNKYLGEKLISEYLFYTDEKNYLNDVNFIEKMNFVKNKYETEFSIIFSKVNSF